MAGPERRWTQRSGETLQDLVDRVNRDLAVLRPAQTGSTTPSLTHADVLSLLGTARAAVQTLGWYRKGPYFPQGWYEVLGYLAPGDKFRVDQAWRNRVADPALAEMGLLALQTAADELDAAGATGPASFDLWPEASRFRHYAQVAWDQLQSERAYAPAPSAPTGTIPVPPLPVPIPGQPPGQTPPGKLPTIPTPIKPTTPSLRGGALIWILIVGLVYFGRKN